MAEKESLLDRIKKNTTLSHTAILTESSIFNDAECITSDVPAFNILASAQVDKAFEPGLTVFAGPSKHFKTAFLLLAVRSFQQKHKDGITIFYDSEFGAPLSYFDAFGIDKSRVVHCPITNIEMWKQDIAKQIDGIKRGDKVFIAVDSVGNLASLKEVEDALAGKDVTDMTRAKQLKSVFRIVTPSLTLKNIYMCVVAHVYQELGMFPKTILGGGTGMYLSADTIWFIGRSKEKGTGAEAKETIGYTFTIRAEKSRYVKEGATIGIKVTHEGGIVQYSGLLGIALESGHVIKHNSKPLKYSRVDVTTGEVSDEQYTEEELEINGLFWEDILSDLTFISYVNEQYSVAYKQVLTVAGPTETPAVEEKKNAKK